MLEQIGGTGVHVLGALPEHLLGQVLAADNPVAPGVDLERPDGDHNDGHVRMHPGDGALEVHEALQAHVRPEAGLSKDVPAASRACRGDAVGDHR